MPGYCPASLRRLLLVKNLPLQAERHSGEQQKLFAFPPESVFAFRPESRSDSQRNGVRLQTGIAFTFDRISQIMTLGEDHRFRYATSWNCY